LTLPTALSDKTVKSFVDKLTPSPFGKGNQTVLDPNVRNALEAKADNLKCSFKLEDYPEILENVKKHLMFDDDQTVTAELHKLNVYQKDGFFLSHRDTPRNQEMFGSLVVCLPIIFTGGILAVKNDSKKVEMNWGFEYHRQRFLWKPEEDKAIQGVPEAKIFYTAFYADCEHEISRVDYGYRMTLSYLLFRPQSSVSKPLTISSLLEERIKKFRNFLKEALKNKDFFPDGELLGFGCYHLYEEEELPKEGKEFKNTTKSSEISLKGADALIAISAMSLGLKVKPIRIVSHTEAEDPSELFEVKNIPKKCPNELICPMVIGNQDSNLVDQKWIKLFGLSL